MSLHIWWCQDAQDPSSCSTFTPNSHWVISATGKKKGLCLCIWGRFSHIQLFAALCTVACQASLSVGFSRQKYWSVLANTGCHNLLEHYISCCPSCQFPWVPGAVRVPVIQVTASPPHLASLGQTQVLQGSLRSKTQQRWK